MKKKGYNITLGIFIGLIAGVIVGLIDGDFEKFGATITKNDHVMTFMPLKNKEPYEKAYQNWLKELNIILNNK